jgi:hypothetical protein
MKGKLDDLTKKKGNTCWTLKLANIHRDIFSPLECFLNTQVMRSSQPHCEIGLSIAFFQKRKKIKLEICGMSKTTQLRVIRSSTFN